MHIDQLNEAEKLAQPYGIVLTSPGSCPGIVVQYVPLLGTSAAAATVMCEGATNLKFRISGATPTGDDLLGLNTQGRLTFATYTDGGLLLDAINGCRAWRAYLQGMLRGDSSTWLVATTTGASALGDNGLVFKMDADVSDCISVALSGEKFVNNGYNGHYTDATDKCYSILTRLVTDMPDSYKIYIYSAPQVGTETLLYQSSAAVASGTATTLGNTTGLDDIFCKSKMGERLVIRVALVTTSAQIQTIDKFEVLGKTVVVSGTRIVDEDNF